MKAPGSIAKHVIITPVCRQNRTDEGAFDEAVARLKEEYFACLPYHADRGSNFHLILSVERQS